MFLLYHAYVYLEFLILACTIYILAPISTITASLEKLRNEEDPLYVLLELIAGDNEELVDFYFKMVGFH